MLYQRCCFFFVMAWSVAAASEASGTGRRRCGAKEPSATTTLSLLLQEWINNGALNLSMGEL